MRKLLKNSIYGSGSFIVISIIALITTPYYVFKLTTEVYGVYILLTSLIGFYGLVDLGLGQGVVKFVSEKVARGERSQVARYINTAVFVQFIIGILVTVLLSFYADELVKLLKIPTVWTSVSVLGIRLCSFGFLFSMLSNTLASALQGLQRFDVTSTIDVSMNIILNVAIVCLLLFGYGLKEIIYATTISTIVIFIVYVFFLRLIFQDWKYSFFVNRKELKELFQFSIYLFISRASNLFANYIVRYIVAAFAGPAAVAIFIVPTKLVNAIGGILGSGVNAIFPYASEINAREPKNIKHIFSKSTRALSIISVPIMIFIIFYSKQIMTIWIGSAFASESYLILSLLALSSMVASQSTIPNLIITGMGYSKTLGIFGFLSLLCYSIFIPYFTNNYNIIGTAFGMLLSAIISTFIVFIFTTKLIGISLLDFIKSTFIHHLLPVTLFAIISISLSHISINNTTLTVLTGIFLLVVYYSYVILNDKVIKSIVEVRWKKVSQKFI